MRIGKLAVFFVLLFFIAGFSISSWPQKIKERIAAIAVRSEKKEIKVGEVSRSYLVHVPRSVDPKKRLSLVIAFHGGGSNAVQMERYSRLDEIADREGFLVAYPEGTNRQWNDGRPIGPKADDIGFTRALIAQLKKDYRVDDRRIFATGISNGGMMSQRVACELSETFAAVASVAATMPDAIVSTCKPGNSISVMLLHGTDDPLVPYAGGTIPVGTGGKVTSAAATAKFWSEHDGCSNGSKKATLDDKDPTDGTRIGSEKFTNCKDGTEVLFYTVNGGGHTLPGRIQYLPEGLIGKTSKDTDGGELIWSFFADHAKK